MREPDLLWMSSLGIRDIFSLKSHQKGNQIISFVSLTFFLKMKCTVYTSLDVHVSFMDAKSNFWEYVILAQSYRFFVDEKLSLSFVNLWKNFLNHTVGYVVAQLLPSRDSRKKIYMHLVSELHFYFAFPFYFSGSNYIKCPLLPPNPKPGLP